MAFAILKGAGLALVACSLGQVMALSEVPTCFVTGRGYNDPTRNSTPNGLFQATALLCQQLCNRTVYCAKFTWYNDSLGCWLQGDHDEEIEYPHAVSGPAMCPETPIGINTSAVTDREFTLDDETPAKKEGGGFPWWILLALLALIPLCALAWYCMTSKDKKKKKKTVKKETPAAREMEEGAPLVAATAAPAAAAAAPLQAASIQYAPTAQAAAPMMMMAPGASVASPVAYNVSAPAMSVVAAPQYSYQQTSSRQMMIPMAQPMQAPVQMVATQPAAANDLFNQFDANGDGVLSREEMDAGMASLQQQR